MASQSIDPGPEGASSRSGRLRLFGHEATPATVRLLARSRRWRTLRALRVAGVGLLVAPLVTLVPPHAPWALGAVVGTLFLARRRFGETHTLVDMGGPCPHCGEDVAIQAPTRLRRPHPVACEACHHEVTLHLDGVPRDQPRTSQD